MTAHANERTAIFAGGCFWCMQPVFDATPGVTHTEAGYTGGDAPSANYDAVSSGQSDHVEAIRISYDPARISYARLLDLYWQNIDPFDTTGQFADKGTQYHTAIFYADAQERSIAEASRHALQEKFPDTPIATDIRPASAFYPAETYHQEYYRKDSLRYNLYKHGSGRVSRLKELWGK